jgi:hypothetical protein
LDALEFEGAFVEGLGVAIEADGEPQPELILGFDHFGEGVLVRLLRGFVVQDQGLQLPNEPVDDGTAEDEEEEKRGQEEPTVVHAGGVVDGVQKFGCVHVGHWKRVSELVS